MSTDENTQTNSPLSFVSNIIDGQIDRMDTWFDKMQGWQESGFDKTETAIDEMADLSKSTLRYTQRLTEEWQKLSTETLRRATSNQNDKS